MWAAALPAGADITVFHAVAIPDGAGTVVTGVPPLEDPDIVVLLAEPYSFPAASFLAKLNGEQPGLPVVGGLAAAGGAARARARSSSRTGSSPRGPSAWRSPARR